MRTNHEHTKFDIALVCIADNVAIAVGFDAWISTVAIWWCVFTSIRTSGGIVDNAVCISSHPLVLDDWPIRSAERDIFDDSIRERAKGRSNIHNVFVR